jgi:hypothetical protein
MAERRGSDRSRRQPLRKAIERPPRVESDLDPDPLFRRRLRGVVVNRHVAIREGIEPAPEPARPRMGRLGRACLYASVTLAASVSGVMAVSEQALPGDVLYPIKREIEALRFEVLPPDLHDELRAAVLTERIDEMRRLAASGEWSAVARLGDEVAALGATAASLEPAQRGVLAGLLDQLPPPARSTVEAAIQAPVVVLPGGAQTDGATSGDEPSDPAGAGAGSTTVASPPPTAAPSSSPSPTPTASPSPTSTPSPSPSPTPTASPTPSPTPTATPPDDDD